jgi:hypothetical protein
MRDNIVVKLEALNNVGLYPLSLKSSTLSVRTERLRKVKKDLLAFLLHAQQPEDGFFFVAAVAA